MRDAAAFDLPSGDASDPGCRPAAWHAERGIALLDGERWEDAGASLRTAIAGGDTSPETALNLALAQARVESPERARRAIAALEDAYPQWDEPPFRLAELLRAEGQSAAAAAAYERALAVAPGRTHALLRLATLHIGCGAPRRAETLLIRCCGVAPDNWEAWDALGVTTSLLGDYAAARAAFRRAHALNPDNLGVALRLAATAAKLDQVLAELSRLEMASVADPLRATDLAARSVLLRELSRDEEAFQLLEAAVAIAPDSVPLASLRAEHLLRGGRYREALQALRDLVAVDPDNLGMRNNLAVALTRTHRYVEALQVLDDLAALDGDRVDMLCNRANALVCLGRQEEGVATALRAITLAPDGSPDRHLAMKTHANALAYCETVTGAALGRAMRAISDSAPRRADGGQPAPRRPMGPARRLRIGLLSATLKTHPVGWLTLAGFENLDQDQFEIVCIGQREGRDAMQRRFRAVACEWHPWADADPRDLAEKVRGLQLDVLIDLGGYGDQGLLSVCARRLAPVQVKWVGMQNHSTGMPEIDWFVTDRWETPPNLAHLYSERLLMLPDGYVCYSPPVHAPPVATLPALRQDAVTFGCFNNLAKVTPRVIAAWSDILREVPGARLILKTHQLDDAETAASIAGAFDRCGAGADRVVLRGSSYHPDLLAEYADVDIVLDPFPYSGGLTTCEALWMGVPVLTCPGETFASRHSASHMSNLGLADWVVSDLEAYRREAVRRAADLPALARLRKGLRGRMRASPLCDAPRFGRHLGEALRHAWDARQES